jgi:hypothetical protein
MHKEWTCCLFSGRDKLKVIVSQIEDIQTRIAGLETQVLAWHKSNPVSQRLATIPGIGPIIATAVVATVAGSEHIPQWQRAFAPPLSTRRRRGFPSLAFTISATRAGKCGSARNNPVQPAVGNSFPARRAAHLLLVCPPARLCLGRRGWRAESAEPEGRVLINRDCSAIAGCRKSRVPCVRCSGDLLPPSPPAEAHRGGFVV